jgi:hypothetical protein
MAKRPVGKPKGQPKTPGSGRKKGSLNKVTADVKSMIAQALIDAGGAKYLLQQAQKENPTGFLQLVKSLVPTTIRGEGEDGAIPITLIERKIVK